MPQGEQRGDEDSDAEVEAAVMVRDADEDLFEYALAAEISELEALEPRTLTEARGRADWPLWEKAVEEELATLHAAGTWVFEMAPPNANVVGSKWVFKAKKDAAGNIRKIRESLRRLNVLNS